MEEIITKATIKGTLEECIWTNDLPLAEKKAVTVVITFGGPITEEEKKQVIDRIGKAL